MIALLADAFDRYKEDTLELARAVSEIVDNEADKKEVEAIKESTEACTVPSEIVTLHEYGDALVSKSITSLETVYKAIFEIDAEIARENPSTEVYPVE